MKLPRPAGSGENDSDEHRDECVTKSDDDRDGGSCP